MNEVKTLTGRVRKRTTGRSVKIIDRLAQTLITLGGVGTIAAVCLVCVFLVIVVLPLFHDAQVQDVTIVEQPHHQRPLGVAMDEYQTMALALYDDGRLVAYAVQDGRVLDEHSVTAGDAKMTAATLLPDTGDAVFGYDDGSVRTGTVRFTTSFLSGDELSPELAALKRGQTMAYQKGVAMRTAQNQVRVQRLALQLDDPVKPESPAGIKLIDGIALSAGPVYTTLNEDGKLRLRQTRKRRNMLTGKTTISAFGCELPFALEPDDPPQYLKLSGLGDNVFLIWEDGRLMRFDTRDFANPRLAETIDVTPEGDKLTAVDFQVGRTTLVTGDAAGRVRAWFRIKPDRVDTSDGALLVMVHELPKGDSAVTALASSMRSRMVAAGYQDGSVRLFYVTTNFEIATFDQPGIGAVHSLVMAPKDNGVLALVAGGMARWTFDPAHPAVTLKSIFLPVWYEGYEKPATVWQSSGGTDDFEPKYGLWPLVFGTLKATFYSMLFGLPIALMAAIYTSEFMHRSTRAKVKPTIELMASLPSVVLGFLAGLVFAPMVEDFVPAVLACLFVVPFCFALGAHLWQMLPQNVTMRYASLRMIGIFMMLPVGIVASFAVGSLAQRLLFAGDIKAWLDGRVGSGVGGWMLLFIPLAALLVAGAVAYAVNGYLRQVSSDWSRNKVAWVNLGKFLLGTALTLALALALASLFTFVLGWDPRGSFVDTYVQRNAMVVGFVMGFAIIPIIYTIADDAMTAVPEHLRAGSLGAGATQWQTATRIIIPTAMSGLFSAMMIGLGRAVGETMIVLMAAGNTPVLEMNIFNGFRTLAANIAVELPEAPMGATHYRMLFLAALSLFVMTFAVNTVAEMVRLRFRKRAFQL